MNQEQNIPSAAALANMLQWWADAGVDTLVAEQPHDWLHGDAQTQAAPAKGQPDCAKTPPQALPDTLEPFLAYVQESDRRDFAWPSARHVPPAGDTKSDLMILTGMPSLEDCDAGYLVSGEAGRLLDRMLTAIGRDRSTIYLASLVSICLPAGELSAESAARCATLARHHIRLIAPRAVLLFGDMCSKALLGQSVMQGRGRWHEIVPASAKPLQPASTKEAPIPAITTFHPDRLLEQTSFKAAAWADLQMLMQKLEISS